MTTIASPVPLGTAPAFRLDIESSAARRITVRVAGRLGLATAPRLRRALEGALRAGAVHLVLDLTRVDVLDSVALAAVVAARRRVGPHGSVAVVVAPDSYPELVVRAAGLTSVLECHASQEEAAAAAELALAA